MEDAKILELFRARDEAAITETAAKYGKYCRAIAMNILSCDEDADESVSDTWLGAWNSIPPQSPENLSTYLGKLTRRAALKKWRAGQTEKRGRGQTALALEELAEIIPMSGAPEEGVMAEELAEALNRFVGTLPDVQRRVFLRRYWYLDPVEQIARSWGFTPAKVNSMLHRIRLKLKNYLKKEGYL